MKKKLIIILTSLLVFSFSGCFMDMLQQSHIEANVPVNDDFQKFLTRDLQAYFSEKEAKTVNVSWEFLRNGPTQVGVAYPKYYVWVKVFEKEHLLEEGAVRLAAIDKTEFDITDYVSKAQITSNPKILEEIFPLPVVQKILEK